MHGIHFLYNLQIQAGQQLIPLIVAFAGLIIIILSITFLVFFIFSRQQQNRLVLKQNAMQEEFEIQLMKAQLEVQEYAFHQISEELHDNVGQLLSTTKLLLGIAERGLQHPPDSLKTASETLSKAIHDIRLLSKSLSSEWLHQFNIVENLHAELERLKTAKQVMVKFNANCDSLPLQPQQQVMLFRVMQEALQNSIKHAHASEITVQVQLKDGEVYLCLTDNGTGFNSVSAKKTGLGIMNMKHRIKLLGGNIKWVSNIDEGTKVDIFLPAQKTAA